jgi:hypothetical protein
MAQRLASGHIAMAGRDTIETQHLTPTLTKQTSLMCSKDRAYSRSEGQADYIQVFKAFLMQPLTTRQEYYKSIWLSNM